MMSSWPAIRSDENLDVRMIFRNIGPIRKKFESLQAGGLQHEAGRVQRAATPKE